MFWHFYQNPRQGEVYNAGGGRFSNCSMAEAIALCQEITGKPMNYEYTEANRIGDHIWWISDVSKFKAHYPAWTWQYGINDILSQIHTATIEKN
jgi:CDP-paratose 2-epimerase